jgi:hypothetical protein
LEIGFFFEFENFVIGLEFSFFFQKENGEFDVGLETDHIN